MACRPRNAAKHDLISSPEACRVLEVVGSFPAVYDHKRGLLSRWTLSFSRGGSLETIDSMTSPQALDKALGLDHPTDKVKQDTDGDCVPSGSI